MVSLFHIIYIALFFLIIHKANPQELDITAFHQDQIISYLNFARYKRNQHLREVDATFKETAESRYMHSVILR